MTKFFPGLNRQFWILAAGLFLTVNRLTGTFEAASDGYDEVGFPLRFYAHTGGKCQECLDFWHWPAFLLDVGCCLLVSWLAVAAYRQLTR